MLGVSEFASSASLVAQLFAMASASLIGRFILKSRGMIWLISALGALGAMVALVLVDGQGAFLFVLLVPLIYFVAVVGRDDLDGRF